MCTMPSLFPGKVAATPRFPSLPASGALKGPSARSPLPGASYEQGRTSPHVYSCPQHTQGPLMTAI